MKKIVFILTVAICATTHVAAQTFTDLLRFAQCTDSTQAQSLLEKEGFTFPKKENYFQKNMASCSSDTTGEWSHNLIEFYTEKHQGEILTSVTFVTACKKEMDSILNAMEKVGFKKESKSSVYQSTLMPGCTIDVFTIMDSSEVKPEAFAIILVKRNT